VAGIVMLSTLMFIRMRAEVLYALGPGGWTGPAGSGGGTRNTEPGTLGRCAEFCPSGGDGEWKGRR
jgi:hypothetical protein